MSGNASKLKDDLKVDIKCPHCGKEFQQLFGWFKNEAAIRCPKCKKSFPSNEAVDRVESLARRHHHAFGE